MKADKKTGKNSQATPGIGSGKPGPGRPPGSKNKLSMAAKDAFQHAFDALGGPEALKRWAVKNREVFYRLYARLIPLEHTGPLGGPFPHTHDHHIHRDTRKLSDAELADDLRKTLSADASAKREPPSTTH